jgi:hypothetical protein
MYDIELTEAWEGKGREASWATVARSQAPEFDSHGLAHWRCFGVLLMN